MPVVHQVSPVLAGLIVALAGRGSTNARNAAKSVASRQMDHTHVGQSVEYELHSKRRQQKAEPRRFAGVMGGWVATGPRALRLTSPASSFM
jgi:hypothetical protein